MENQELDLKVPESSPYRGDFISTPARQGLVDQLIHLLQFGEGVPVLVGEQGAGKSFLVSELRQQLSHFEFSPLIKVGNDPELSEVLATVADQLGLLSEDQASAGELLSVLRHFTASLASEQQQGILLIDDAHKLDDSSLGALISLLQGHDDSGYGMHLLFISLPGLVERLDAMQLIDVPVYDFEMPLLSAKELGDLLKHLGLVVDGSAASAIVRQVWARSQGNPGLAISLLADPASAKNEGNNEEQPQSKKGLSLGLPLGHVMAMALLVLVLTWALLGRNTEDLQPPATSITPPQGERVLKQKTPLHQPVLSAPSESEVQLEVLPEREAEIQAPLPTTSPTIISNPLPTIDRSLKATSAPTVIPTPVPTPIPTIIPTPKPTPVVQPFSADENFLLKQADSKYSLQVLAASKRSSLEDYIQKQPNKGALYLYQGYREGRRWYVVLAGIYASKDAAMAARAKLPEQQRKAGPWPRPLKEIKREIVDNRQK